MSPPLAGVRVVELARILAGPWAGQVLADLGADVVKIESPQGDDTRQWGPPFVHYADGGRDAAYFHACNRGKRSVVADLATPTGAQLALELCLGADIVIENFKRGDLARYGLDAAKLRALHPRLIYCSITGFGQDGPYADLPGYDFIVQAMGGIMDLTGAAEGPAQKPGVAYADLFTGLYAAIAVQSALLRRASTGEGAHIDLALLDTQVAVLANQAMNFLVAGEAPRRMGNAHPNLVPYQVFTLQDGDLVIAVGNDAQFRRLVTVLGMESLADDPAMRRNEDRVRNRKQVVEVVQQACGRFKRVELAALLMANGVPAGPINTLPEVFADPQVRSREMATTAVSRDGERVPAIRLPVRISGHSAMGSAAAPRLGQHQMEVEQELARKRARSGGDTPSNPTQCG